MLLRLQVSSERNSLVVAIHRVGFYGIEMKATRSLHPRATRIFYFSTKSTTSVGNDPNGVRLAFVSDTPVNQRLMRQPIFLLEARRRTVASACGLLYLGICGLRLFIALAVLIAECWKDSLASV